MSDTQKNDLIRRACINLQTLRTHLPGGYVSDETYYKIFERALDQLEQTGEDINEWRIPRQAVGQLDSPEFLVRVDAVLMYFTTIEAKTTIGFGK